MKKLALFTASVLSLLSPVNVFAVDINITPPNQGYNDLGNFITNIIQLAFAFALLLVLVMLVWGAFEWISSGGDKEAVGKARGRIINALIGLAVLAIAFALATVGAQFLGFSNLNKITIPGPVQSCKPMDTTFPNSGCKTGFSCKAVTPATDPVTYTCQL